MLNRDHPIIEHMERTGRPRRNDDIYCPACGEELTDEDLLFVRRYDNEVLGCRHCAARRNARDVIEEIYD